MGAGGGRGRGGAGGAVPPLPSHGRALHPGGRAGRGHRGRRRRGPWSSICRRCRSGHLRTTASRDRDERSGQPLAPDLVAGLKRLKLAKVRAMAPEVLQARSPLPSRPPSHSGVVPHRRRRQPVDAGRDPRPSGHPDDRPGLRPPLREGPRGTSTADEPSSSRRLERDQRRGGAFASQAFPRRMRLGPCSELAADTVLSPTREGPSPVSMLASGEQVIVGPTTAPTPPQLSAARADHMRGGGGL